MPRKLIDFMFLQDMMKASKRNPAKITAAFIMYGFVRIFGGSRYGKR